MVRLTVEGNVHDPYAASRADPSVGIRVEGHFRIWDGGTMGWADGQAKIDGLGRYSSVLTVRPMQGDATLDDLDVEVSHVSTKCKSKLVVDDYDVIDEKVSSHDGVVTTRHVALATAHIDLDCPDR